MQAEDPKTGIDVGIGTEVGSMAAGFGSDFQYALRIETERHFKLNEDKTQRLDGWLPRLKKEIQEFLETSTRIRAVFLQAEGPLARPGRRGTDERPTISG